MIMVNVLPEKYGEAPLLNFDVVFFWELPAVPRSLFALYGCPDRYFISVRTSMVDTSVRPFPNTGAILCVPVRKFLMEDFQKPLWVPLFECVRIIGFLSFHV